MNRLPEVKKFIYEDIPMFHNVIFKAVPGAPPEAVMLNKLDQVCYGRFTSCAWIYYAI